MKKIEQSHINGEAVYMFEKAMDEFFNEDEEYIIRRKLRSCQAEVVETENFYLLKSYGTYIACIEKSTDTLYDVLRHEYGYTATSAQHISKFSHDYGKGKWGCANRMTWR